MRAWICAVLTAAIATGSLATAALAKTTRAKPAPRYYVALGDSLSVGFQPTTKTANGHETNQGYTNDLAAHYAKQIHGLKLQEFGCPGDTTGSLLTGKGNDATAKLFHCDRHGGSQLKAAVAFLKAHHARGEVPLITIDIGANDVDGCAGVPLQQVAACVSTGEHAIKTNTPKILSALRKAAPKGARLVGMNLYDPVLADELLSPYDPAYVLGSVSVPLVQAINKDIAQVDTAAGFKTADVASAFDTYATTPTSYNGQQVPLDVAKICQLTWMCAAAPLGPNIHANKAGYAVIAGAFEKVLGKL